METRPTSKFCLPLLPLLQQQASAGWHTLLLGVPTVGWREALERHFRRLGEQGRTKRWMVQFLCLLAAVSWDQLEFRKGLWHKQTAEEDAEFECIRIADLVLQGSRTAQPKDRYLFRRDMDYLHSMSADKRQAWILSVETAQDAATNAVGNWDTERRVLRRWLRTPAP